MKIIKIELYNFRNYNNLILDLKDGLNVIVGGNAQGKTNLIEAIYFCALGKSFRTSKEKEVIAWGKEISKIKLTIEKEIGTKTIEIIFSKSQKKTVKIDGLPIKKIGELMGELKCVFFAPDELKLIKDSPEDRRKFMDIHISQTSKQYFYNLGKYNKLIDSRNKTLKDNVTFDEKAKLLSIYDRQLAKLNLEISAARKLFVEKLLPYAAKMHNYITSNAEDLHIEYVGIKENTEEQILEKFKSLYEKDIRLGYTTFGIHKDDIKICINGVDVRSFGSQGQQRTCALSLKLAELEIMRQEDKALPVLLLDDVLSELDENRKMKLVRACGKAQTFITCTDFNFDVPRNEIVIKQGSVQ